MLDIYKASAGSGKTFALTLEYFRIVFENPADYKNILAVTFTNKATEEMKSRIINELHCLAMGRKSDYGELLKNYLHLSDDQLQNRAKLIITMLLHDYGRLSVTTIDRFFQRLIKSFTRELGIFPGYNVELDSGFVLQKAIDRMMQQVKGNEELRNWIAELMSNSVEEGKSWSVKARIAELGEELFKENYMLFDRKVLDKFSDKEFLKRYRIFLNDIIGNFEKSLSVTGKEAVGLICGAGLDLSDFKGNKSGCAALFYKLAAGNFDEPTATARKGVDNPESWMTKTSPLRAKIESLAPQLSRLLRGAVETFDREYRDYASARYLAANLYQLGIMNDLCLEIRNYCNDKGVMLLSDTTLILNRLIDGNDTSFLFEKAGNYYKHLMIDEFQDTSAMQWKNFRPLMVNSLSEGSRALIVGDVKQSIYRWRNGDWSLLAYEVEKEFSGFGVNNVVLKNNWRSARLIVEFNNTFFSKAARVMTALYDADAGENNPWSAAITDAYHDVIQHPSRQKNGYVEVSFGPEKKEEESDRTIMDGVMNVIHDVIGRGGELRDMVILVRSGKEGAFVADYIMQYNETAEKPIGFISNDSLYVWSSPYVQFITAVLKYILSPYDMVNRATILSFYRRFVLGMEDSALDETFRAAADEDLFGQLNTDFTPEVGRIMSYSLYETVESIIDRFSLRDRSDEVPYLIAFQDIIFEYEANASNSIALFLEWWEKEQGKKVLSTSEEVNAVRILTIHKSKGLEFDYVIVPFCNWELDTVRPSRCIWCSNNEEGFNQLDYAPLNYSSKLASTIFREDYFDEHLKAYVDSLNLLYVAMTRARTELYIRPYSPKFNKDGTVAMSDIGAFIYYVLAALKIDPVSGVQPDDSLCVHFGEKADIRKKESAGEQALGLDSYPVYDSGGRVKVRYRFSDYTEPDGGGLSAVDEGKLLHDIFRSVGTAADVEAAVRQAAISGLIPSSEMSGYVAKIHACIADPQAASWFAPTNRVINERDILFPKGKKARPDRVVMDGNTVKVIDYKFGQNEDDRYLKQVGFYCATLRKMGYADVEGYVWYVKAGKIIRI